MNGHIELRRERFGDKAQGSEHACDRLVDQTEAAVSVGVRQLTSASSVEPCVREGSNARSFDRGRDNLEHAAQVTVGEEQFRVLVESEGKAVLESSADEQLELDWSAAACKTKMPDGKEVARVYVSGDGVLDFGELSRAVPTTTQQEKDKRRATVLKKRQSMPPQRRRELKPLRKVKRGSDQRYKQVYLTCFYDQGQAHRLVGVTCKQIGGFKRLLKREAARVRLRGADERLGMVDGLRL